jgi:hypothetical protein
VRIIADNVFGVDARPSLLLFDFFLSFFARAGQCRFNWRRVVTFSTFVTLGEVMNPALRAAVIAEWRGLSEKPPLRNRWQSAGELLPKLMHRLGLRERLQETEVIEAWSKIVGDFIAAHSTPVALREGVLYVRVLQPALHYELEQISKIDILRKLKRRFGSKTIRDVRFRVG